MLGLLQRRSVRRLLIASPFLGLIAFIMVFALMTGSMFSSMNLVGLPGTCGNIGTSLTPQGEQRRFDLSSEQLDNANSIIAAGREIQIPPRGLIIAVATALQESTLRNIPYGDRDSVGLFQQRDAWGSFAERMNPRTSALMFFQGGRAGQRGLLDIPSWETMPLTQAAQAVQVSAFPLAYAKWESLATALVGAVGSAPSYGSEECTDVLRPTLPAGPVGDMVSVALAQQGDPYVWGAVGPNSFDCSGLVVYAWQQAGYRLKIRTASQMWSNSTPIPEGQEQPGDLYFGQFGARGPGPGHVMIVVKPGLLVQAPRSGDVVKLTNYEQAAPGWKFARLKPDVISPLPGNAAITYESAAPEIPVEAADTQELESLEPESPEQAPQEPETQEPAPQVPSPTE